MDTQSTQKLVEPRTLSGFMELLPTDQVLFNYIKDEIRCAYEKFGFLPLDTPIIEDGEVLLAKVGGETEQQIYRAYHNDPREENTVLRFDLTVPLAKYVAKNFNNLSFPFRRYQIGKVYRGERPQKGRFREFYQCDIDVIGNNTLSIVNDAEIPSIIYTIFKNLGFKAFTIQINNRKFLSGFLNHLGVPHECHGEVLHLLDKVRKVGLKETEKSLLGLIDKEKVEGILNLLSLNLSTDEKIAYIKGLKSDDDDLKQGAEELAEVVRCIRLFGVPEEFFCLDFSIVRGLDYYTGTVYETFITGHEEIGSVCSGGRYDNLAGFYTKERLPGVGISIGLTRLFDKLKEIIQPDRKTISDVIIFSADEDYSDCLSIAADARANGLCAEVYVENAKLKNKMKYANRLGVPYVILVGEEERRNNLVLLKNMISAEQKTVTRSEALEEILKAKANRL